MKLPKLLSKKNEAILVKRSKSLLWRIAMMSLSVIVTFGLENLELLEVPPAATLLLGLVLGEVSKWLAKNRK